MEGKEADKKVRTQMYSKPNVKNISDDKNKLDLLNTPKTKQ